MHAPFRHLSEEDIARIEAWLTAKDHTRWIMARAPHDGRPPMVVRVASTVNAQSVRVTERERVADSFDARPAEDRSTARPYSSRQAERDVRYSLRPRLAFDARSIRIPRIEPTALAPLSYADEIRAAEDRGATWATFTAPETERESRKGRKVNRKSTAAEDRAQRMRAAAGTVVMGEVD